MSDEYWKNLRCSYCNSKGKIYPARSEVVGTERAFGYVTRTQIVQTTGQGANPVSELILGQGGGTYSRQQVVYTQERVPVVRTKIRTVYQRTKCFAFVGDKTFIREVEDLSAPQLQTVVQKEFHTEVQKEILKVPCRYCKTLLDPIRDKKCPNCGSVVGT